MMLFDHFWEAHFGIMQSADGVNWKAIDEPFEFPPGVRHASVLQIEVEEARRLLQAWS